MQTSLFLRRQPHAQPFGFSLTELLVVITIASLLAMLSLPMYTSIVRSNRLSSGLHNLCRMLDLARQHAIAKNTYVWILIAPSSDAPASNLAVAMVASTSGTDSLAWTISPLALPATAGPTADLEILTLRSLPELRIENEPTIQIVDLPESSTHPASLASVNIEITAGGKPTTFTRACQFTPTGQVRVSEALVYLLDMAVLPQNTSPLSPDQAVLRLAGLTGKAYMYRN